jgi:secondary thiamine-phosphate synthase enzyme
VEDHLAVERFSSQELRLDGPHAREDVSQPPIVTPAGGGYARGVQQRFHTLDVRTRGRGLYDFTQEVAEWLRHEAVGDGLLTLFIQHTSASLLVQENADPEVRADLERFFSRLVKDGDPLFRHDTEGPDDMPSHIRAALTQTHLAVPVRGAKLWMGTWQGLYLYEHRHAGHLRHIALHYAGT